MTLPKALCTFPLGMSIKTAKFGRQFGIYHMISSFTFLTHTKEKPFYAYNEIYENMSVWLFIIAPNWPQLIYLSIGKESRWIR